MPRRAPVDLDLDLTPATTWFTTRAWTPFPFQREVWSAMAEGRSGLLHATTGSGKTLAAWLGALLRHRQVGAAPAGGQKARSSAPLAAPLSILWLTPMRALAADTARALQAPLDGPAALVAGFSVGLRTGDTPPSERARQDRRLPSALVTTPESLTLMLTRADAADRLAGVHTVVVDEWHELLASKRGVQVQLALARLRRWRPDLVVWGLSATLGNLDDALAALLGPPQVPPQAGALAPVQVRGRMDKSLQIDTLLPADPGQFSWAGHLGAQMQQPVVDEIAREMDAADGPSDGGQGGSTLIFTNVRSQAEAWYQLLLAARPDWAGVLALHHGSLDREVRDWVEAGLKAGSLRAVVATSSLDLGVDFLPVARVLQIGSAKGVARLLQRAGRSGHAPGRASRVTLVPTHTLELVEAVAARRAALAGRVEERRAPEQPLDVLVQHLVTLALGGGFAADPHPGVEGAWTSDEIFDEVRGAYSYRALARAEFDWALDFVTRGGASLGAYPEYHRVVRDDLTGRFGVPDRGIALRHRLGVGTIVGEASMQVKWLTGGKLGTVEEGFIARLKKGDCFVFAGRLLEYVRTQDMAAYVRRATKKRGIVPAWSGGRMPLSTELADATLEVLAAVRSGRRAGQGTGQITEPELQAAAPMLDAQQRLSRLPTPETLLVEAWTSREGHHLYVYPFAGRNVHLGLASLLAWRLSKAQPNTWSISVNDYGFELLAAQAPAWSAVRDGSLFSTADLLADVLASLNSSEMAQRRFREIARVAGLVNTGYPGAPRSTRQLQASSSLFYEVFRKYDAGNLLLAQAEREVLAQELDIHRLTATLDRLRHRRLEWVDLPCPSPFSLPLLVERLRDELSTERLADRLKRILDDAQRRLDG